MQHTNSAADSDRFESLRVPIECRVEVRLDADGTALPMVAGNISMSGMFLRTSETLSPGTRVRVRFCLRDDEPEIVGKAEVTWCRVRNAGPDQPTGIGVRFLDLDLESKYSISCLVDRYLQIGGIPVDPGTAGFTSVATGRAASFAGRAWIPAFLVGLALGLALGMAWMRLASFPKPAVASQQAVVAEAEVIPTSTSSAATGFEEARSPRRDPSVKLEKAVQAWAAAWSEKDIEGYLGFYSQDFQPSSGASFAVWKSQRRQRFERPGFVRVEIDELAVEELAEGRLRTLFDQSYASESYRDRVRKALEWAPDETGWKIIREEVAGKLDE